ncbi:nucleotidyltransferase family protein [Cellvibrio sp. KY-GH-1]|uniref:nucleotidyltransferase family protein n=1 Tax=Cellvibrio sp. KY-GH-1 TaxID=2303332 RepID=UPI001247FBF6|nr:nucleotidyltransferase family protein [Cellvibrio sp. KY-GH-1]QEY18118.1 nucleotidyltransferase family protein [Cellvibrio sp. KY-GH-1]
MAIDCVILAAGAATRFGSCKLLADYLGQPLIAHILDAAHAVTPARIVLVTGASHAKLTDYCATLAVSKLEIAYCDDWQLGMGHSLAHGVAQVNNDNPVLVLLGDQPQVSAADLLRLYRCWKSSPTQIVCASFADTLGVPAIFPAEFKAHLLACSGDRGAKQLLFQQAEHVLAIPMPSAEFDIDTPADMEREFPFN